MLSTLLVAAQLLSADVPLPKILDDRLQLQLVAAAPDVVTPTGIAVDRQGRVLVIESHTHFPPKDYPGPKADRILLLEDFDPATGQARKIRTFYEGTTHTMGLAVYRDGSVFVATRMEVFRLWDKDGDGQAETREPICRLETPGNYPHNGLSGFAFDFAGNVYFGFGENLGAEYKLIGTDDKTQSGGGEGGNIYCCDPQGKNLRRVATGFWNPFHLCFDAFGRLFTVDNDPDSRPPCRLLHVVEGGDYGFRFRHGRKGVHPFTAWNGELPGTLPMVSGTGEAPSGMLAYESDNLPDEYRGDVLVTSWGDHRLERYRLKPRGASFSAEMTTVLLGDQNFRPVGIALAPDGSLYMSDWVDKSYQLHRKGRVWRLSAKQPAKRVVPKDDWEALAAKHRPINEAALERLKAKTPDRTEVYQFLTTTKDERAQASAVTLLAADDFYGQALLLGIIGSHPSANVRHAAIQHVVMSIRAIGKPASTSDVRPTQTRPIDIDPKWSAESFALLMQTAESRAYAMSSINPFALSRGGRLAGLPTSPGAEFWQGVRSDPFLLHALVFSFQREFEAIRATSVRRIDEFQHMDSPVPEERLASALAAWRSGVVEPRELVAELLSDADPRNQLVGLMWLAESKPEKPMDYRWRVEKVLSGDNITRQVFEVAIATLMSLDGATLDPKSEKRGEDFVIKYLLDDKSPPAIRRFALRSLRPDHPALTVGVLTKLLASEDGELRLEAIRTLRQRPESERWPQLREIAVGDKPATQERCEAILGLSPGNQDDRKLLFELTRSPAAEVADEALRALRGFDLSESEKQSLTEVAANLAGPRKELAERVLARNPPKDLPKPEDQTAWLALAAGEGNAQAGERIFFHLRVGGCFRCHEFAGRGYKIGPDLSTIGRSMTRERLVQSIVDPSREIAPQFTNWSILTHDGQVHTGIHVGDEVDGRMRFADQNGRAFHVHPNDIDQRRPSSQSIMPAGLSDNLTAQELRDLLAFLVGQPSRLSPPSP